jgi:dolichol-phosphate mannosyltransferase
MEHLMQHSRIAGSGARPLISIVTPCYNEQESIPLLQRAVADAFAARPDLDYELVLVDDGSRDRTAEVLRDLADRAPHLTVVTLSRNFGHQPAVSAGLQHACGDAVIVCDADLQDSPAAMLQMVDRWLEGADVVYGVRRRKDTPALMRGAYFAFYRLLRRLAEVEIPADSGDFGLMDRKVVDAVNALPERNRFVRGLRAWVGYEQVPLVYERSARQAGHSKYSVARLVRLALHGLFDFSARPLTAVFYLGLAVSLLAIAGLLFFILHRIIDFKLFGYSPADVPGFTSLVLAILFLGGVQLLSIGVVGEYVGRIYEEVKRRPSFIVRSIRRSSDAPLERPGAETGGAAAGGLADPPQGGASAAASRPATLRPSRTA